MILRRLILSGLVIYLSACGFQLRGFASLPEHISNLQLLSGNLTTSQQQSLVQQLQRAGATLHHGDDSQAARLRVSIESLPERNLVDSAGSGQAIVRISRQLSYSLVDSTGQRLVDNKQLVSNLDLELDENNLLGSEGEKRSALESLDKTLFSQLMMQLRRL